MAVTVAAMAATEGATGVVMAGVARRGPLRLMPKPGAEAATVATVATVVATVEDLVGMLLSAAMAVATEVATEVAMAGDANFAILTDEPKTTSGLLCCGCLTANRHLP